MGEENFRYEPDKNMRNAFPVDRNVWGTSGDGQKVGKGASFRWGPDIGASFQNLQAKQINLTFFKAYICSLKSRVLPHIRCFHAHISADHHYLNVVVRNMYINCMILVHLVFPSDLMFNYVTYTLFNHLDAHLLFASNFVFGGTPLDRI